MSSPYHSLFKSYDIFYMMGLGVNKVKAESLGLR